jgi:hypothetical protein
MFNYHAKCQYINLIMPVTLDVTIVRGVEGIQLQMSSKSVMAV